eukprot:TRINITY_DN1100_c0_g1_i3.p1 TRINITY_DN1100_c0_g1~~TRINITY_DN1100_c0_g1_i3.p1  ORF type:complete len:557 (+),score=152.96 TRINITY_DN1100_c0_g1_i3:155-1825(+)
MCIRDRVSTQSTGGWFVEMALVDYASSDGEEGAVGEAAGEVSRQLMTLNSAPDVAAMDAQVMCVPATTKEVFSNHTYEAMWAAEEGPAHPFRRTGTVTANSRPNGAVEAVAVNQYDFDEQYNTYQTFGYAMDPSAQLAAGGAGEVIGDAKAWAASQGASVYTGKTNDKAMKRKFWTEWMDEQADLQMSDLTEEQVEYIELDRAKRLKEVDEPVDDRVVEERSIFHGDQETDYQGRSFVAPPSDLHPNDHKCFLPKNLIHTWTGHTKGVTAIRFFPQYGHLLLSASMDSKVKIWDVYNDRRCLRTYMGHTNAVRDICFTNDGRHFLSCGYDRMIKRWDTETGQCIGAYTNRKIPYCVKYNPSENHQHAFIAGCSDKKIIQFDVRSGKMSQRYDAHLGGVNSVTFVDNNRRFVSTSDDKKIYVWEWGLPVVMKHISEPHMHSMPYVCLSPDKKVFVGQSMNNEIHVYGARDKFSQLRKKIYTGHTNAGYACGLDMSPDGKYLLSGDGDGRAFIWDFKSLKVYKKIKAHDKVCIDAKWHPVEPSRMATCSWDGTIKYWD